MWIILIIEAREIWFHKKYDIVLFINTHTYNTSILISNIYYVDGHLDIIWDFGFGWMDQQD